MPATEQSHRSPWLAPPEVLFLASVVVAWSCLVVSLGKDMSWDFRNYHWYIPYAFLNGRNGFDVSVAHQATFYNPFLDIPFYLLATHTRSWIALAAMGAAQGLNVVPIYLMARSILNVPEKRLVSAVVALFCVGGSLAVGLVGATYYDNVMSVLVLSGLAAIICNRELLRAGPLLQGALICGAAGFAIGGAVGLKLPEAPFALGFAAALVVIPGDVQHRASRLAAGALGGILGVVAFAAYWTFHLYHVTGNPLFPYFNQYFQSPLALNTSYRDMRFIPHRLTKRLLYPILFSLDWHVADDLPFQDVRVGTAYVLGLLTIPVAIWRRAGDPLTDMRAAATLFAFAALSYIVWLLMFGIYRYIITLEILAPLLIVSLVGLWPISRYARLLTLGLIGLFVLATTRYEFLDHAPLGDPYVQAAVPPIPHPNDSMVLMTGETPMGYIVPSLPHQVPVLRIDGWMIRPNDGSLLTAETRARVKSYKGDLYVIADEYEVGRAGAALADYGLGMRWTECKLFSTNLGGQYRFCPLKKLPPRPAS